uniref:Uncharacterized protein n=1 Tax=Pongo abelii TaxID=9601 RepID=H2NNY5_PONAB
IILKHHFNPVFPLLTKTNSGIKGTLHFGLKCLSLLAVLSPPFRSDRTTQSPTLVRLILLLPFFSTNPSFDLRNSTSHLKVTVH